ncbi:MAG: hypothetical protein WKF77_05040 [Planctomycetaceae bacterium]
MTPRGLLTWRDSAILLCPPSFSNRGSNGESTWYGAFQNSPWTTTEWAFAPLWCLWVGMKFWNSDASLFGRGDPRQAAGHRSFPRLLLGIARCCVPLAVALLCQENLPICGLWILLDMMQPSDLPLNRVRVTTASRQRLGLAAMAILVLCPVVIDASGRGLTPYRRFGWGIAQEIDPRLLDAQLLSVPAKRVIGWAPDGRSVGLAAWLDGNVLMADHPQRALLGGRAPLHSALITDLLGAHRARYRRDDGTWGGWVRQMADWRVNLVFVPVEMRLHRELTKTTWRPLDLGSPAVPFVSADDARYSEAILEAMAQQGFVELGPWQPTVQIYNGQGWRFDGVEFFGGGIDPAAAIRQSQLFRSMDIPLASLRVLLPVRQQSGNRSLAEEFLACQNDLAYQEWTTFGKASYFRRLVVTALTREQTTSEVPWLTLKSDEDSDGAEAWSICVAFYLQGRISEAVNALPLATSAQHFAAAMLWLELGESGHALKELEHLLSTSDHQAVLIAAKYWHQQVGQFGGP